MAPFLTASTDTNDRTGNGSQRTGSTVPRSVILLRWIVTVGLCVAAADSLHAQGLGIHSHGACALARNSAGVAEPCADGSAVYYNPAAIASQRSVASAGAIALYTTSTFTFDGSGAAFDSEQGTTLAPHAWFAGRLSPRLGAGIGFWAPYGLATAWPLDFEGRFDGYDNSLRAIYMQPTVAGELLPGRLAVGFGVAAVAASVGVRRRIDLARTAIAGTGLHFSDIGVPDGTDFADLHLDVDAWSATFHVGLQFRATDRWSFGARYLHTANLDLSGAARFRQIETGFPLPAGNPFGLPPGTPIDLVLAPQFEPGGPLADQALNTQITLPNQLVAGTRFVATPATQLFFDFQWTGWKHFDRAALHFANAPTDTLFLDYRNAITVRIAIEFAPRDELAIRGGILHNSAAAPAVSVNPLLPESRRTSFTGGLGYRFTDRFTMDMGLELLFQAKRRGRVQPRTSEAQTAADLNVGRYSGYGVFGGATLSYLLGRGR